MSEQADHNLTMPDRSERVRETIERFETSSERPSSLLAMSDPDLFETGLILSDRSLPIADAFRKANELLGGTDEDPVIGRSSFYRFADRFKSLLDQVTAEHRRRIKRLRVKDVTDGNIRTTTRLGRNVLLDLAVEHLVSADCIEDVEKQLSKLAAIVNDAEHVQLKADKLELDRQQYEHRAAKAEAEIEKMRQDAAHKRARFDERLNKLQTQIDELLKRASRGEQITEEHLRHADADLEALRKEAA